MIATPLVLAVAAPLPAATRLAEVRRAAYLALGGDRTRAFAAAVLRGNFIQAGAQGTVDVTIALATGFSRGTIGTGSLRVEDGYDGATWQSENSVLTVADLPGDVADGRANAWLGRDGYADPHDDARVVALERRTEAGHTYDVATFAPPGASSVECWLDATTHLLSRTIVATDGGPDRTDYTQYRRFSGIAIALDSTETAPTGALTTTTLTDVRFLTSLPPLALARPAPIPHGRLAGPTVVRFISDLPGTQGHIAVPVTLDAKPLTVDFDSGGANAIAPESALALGITGTGGVNVSGVGSGSVSATTAVVHALGIGDAVLEDQPFLVLPLPYSVTHPRTGLEVGGLVGFEVLSNFRVGVDYVRHELRLAPFDDPAPPAGTVLPFRSDGHTPYVEATIDGVSGLFAVDTGANATVTVFDAFARAHGLFTRSGAAYVAAGGVGGAVPEVVVRAKSFAIAGTTLPTPVVSIAKTQTGGFASRTIAGNIGSGILGRFDLSFDYRARTIAFAPNALVNAPYAVDRVGLSLTRTAAQTIVVLSVVPQSPAALAGIAVGDRVLAIDGHAFGDASTAAAITRSGEAPFDLTLERAGTQRVVHVVPADFLGAPQ